MVGTSEHAKRDALLSLRAKIIDEWEIQRWNEVWFFPQYRGVNGWQGTADIFFVGSAPSSGRFPSKGDALFYGTLESNGFADAHVTDILKVRARNADLEASLADRTLLNAHKDYFQREMEILQPKLIVALGHDVQRVMDQWKSEGMLLGRVQRIWHYAYPLRSSSDERARKIREFAAQVENVRHDYGESLERLTGLE